MKKYILAGIAISLAHLAFSQTDFRKGYVILNPKDTIFGLVDYREGRSAYTSCAFKRSENVEAAVYLPDQIEGYGFNGDKYFQSRHVSLKHESPGTVFVEVIVRGRVSLYRFEDSYLLEKEHAGLEHLINEQIDVYKDGQQYRRNTYEYVGVLNRLLFDCAKFRGKLNTVELRERSLTNLIEAYNACYGHKFVTFKARKPWLSVRPAVAAGINISKIDFSTPTLAFPHLTSSFERYKAPMAGISVNLSSPRLTERVSFNADIFYTHAEYKAFSMFQNSSEAQRYYATVELRSVKIPLGLRYTFPERKVTPYVNGGVTMDYHIARGLTLVTEVERSQSVNTFYGPDVTIEKKQFGIWCGAGGLVSLWQNFEGFAELRYEKMPNIAAKPVSGTITSIQTIIGIRTKMK